MGLATRKCVPCENGNVQPMDESSAYKLRNQVSHIWKLKAWHTPVTSNVHQRQSRTVTSCSGSALAHHANPQHKSHCTSSALIALQVPGWRVEKTKEGTLCLRQEWKVKNFRCGIDLFKRIGEVAEAEGHHPDLHLEGYSMVSAELSTHSIGEIRALSTCLSPSAQFKRVGEHRLRDTT